MPTAREFSRTTPKPAIGGSKPRRAETSSPPDTPGICFAMERALPEIGTWRTNGPKLSGNRCRFHVENILADKPHPEMACRSCLGLIRLAGRYSSARMEAAAERALAKGACRYQSVKSILRRSPSAESPPATTSQEKQSKTG